MSGISRPNSGELIKRSWIDRPNAAENNGKKFFLTDYSIEMVSDGINWKPIGGNKLSFGFSTPVFIAPPGSVGNNGALTLSIDLNDTYSAGIYLYFPSNAIFSGSVAGRYYCVMSSTTVGTIYNNTYTSGIPMAPASPTGFVTTGPGAYATTLNTDITLIEFPVLGGILGNSGQVDVSPVWNYRNSANTKNLKVYFDSSLVLSSTPTTSTSNTIGVNLTNKTSAKQSAKQKYTSAQTALDILTVDTSVDKSIKLVAQTTSANDFVGVESCCLELLLPLSISPP